MVAGQRATACRHHTTDLGYGVTRPSRPMRLPMKVLSYGVSSVTSMTSTASSSMTSAVGSCTLMIATSTIAV